ncbi:NUDIX domain-containing protein [Sporosarcina sp. Te-1]|uniref:NUDIX domain-containing protein n=1 Tax=Sporosarcina sp. Te-1 TaxID=2818390 RepID=UPI001A9FFA35|nr:NUDIX domain-containing protein [Sporosarcina sp. Te-1]QTD42988.1 NUDIX domain-containing protein [Sporosarcina sp. Te-1]
MSYHIRVKAGAVIIDKDAILLVEFSKEKGIHYNLPGGGVEPDETIIDAVRREAWEEASAEVDVGPLAFVYEYAPAVNEHRYGSTPSLALYFDCTLRVGSIPKYPAVPDPNQTGIAWVPIADLEHIVLYPNIKEQLIDYAKSKRSIELIEERHLKEYSRNV